MTKKLKYEDVSNEFIKNGCELITKKYINSNTKLKYKAACGHINESDFSNFKLWKRYNCKRCNISNSNSHKKKFSFKNIFL